MSTAAFEFVDFFSVKLTQPCENVKKSHKNKIEKSDSKISTYFIEQNIKFNSG